MADCSAMAFRPKREFDAVITNSTKSEHPKSVSKIILALDIGTVNTVIAWKNSRDRDFSYFHLQEHGTQSPSPGDYATAFKCPTKYARTQDTTSATDRDLWGAEVSCNDKSTNYFKLAIGLRPQAPLLGQNIYEEGALAQLYKFTGSWLREESVVKETPAILTDFLTRLREQVLPVVIEQMSGGNLNYLDPIEMWVTVPDDWSKTSKSIMMKAIKDAQFVTRDTDSIQTLTDSMAAILYLMNVHLPSCRPKDTEPKVILVVNCGGGTIDLSTYAVRCIDTKLDYTECVLPDSSKIGSVFVDSEFAHWMERTFRKHYSTLPRWAIGPGSKFMEGFERCRRKFGQPRTEDCTWELPFNMPTAPKSAKYDPDMKVVSFDRGDMEVLFFANNVRGLQRLLDEQWKKLQGLGVSLDMVVVSGGFGQSRYMQLAIEHWVNNKFDQVEVPPQIHCLPHGDTIGVRGAMLRGHEDVYPRSHSRLCHQWIGFKTFMPNNDPISDLQAFPPEKWTKEMINVKRLYWAIERGVRITDGSPFTRKFSLYINDDGRHTFELDLYSSIAKQPPATRMSGSVKWVDSIDLKTSDLESAGLLNQKVQIGRHLYWLLEVEVTFTPSLEPGMLNASFRCAGEFLGELQFNYDK